MVLDAATMNQMHDRRQLLNSFDSLRRRYENDPTLAGLDEINEQALNILTSSKLVEALDLSKEHPRLRDRYGKTQVVVHADGDKALWDLAQSVRSEDVLSVTPVAGGAYGCEGLGEIRRYQRNGAWPSDPLCVRPAGHRGTGGLFRRRLPRCQVPRRLRGDQGGADVDADAIGLFGSFGADDLANTGDITVNSTGRAEVINAGLSPLPFFFIFAPSEVNSDAAGIDGGFGADTVDNQSTLTVNAVSDISVIGTNASSLEQTAFISNTANATAAGVRGVGGAGETTNSGVMDVFAGSLASATDIGLEIVNAVIVDTATNVNATAYGVQGGFAPDRISNSGTVLSDAAATALRGSFVLSLSDGGVASNAVNASARSFGLSGGWGSDELRNSGSITTSAIADASSTSVELNLIDVAGGEFDLSVEARATGMSGGAFGDVLDNSGAISSTATANTTSTSVNLSLIDLTIIGGRIAAGVDSEADADGPPPIQAIAVGMSGDGGDDVLFNRADGTITLSGGANAVSTNVALAALGVPDALFQALFEGETLASLDTHASSQIIGMSGGQGADQLSNLGAITGTTRSDAQQVGVAVSIPNGFLPSAAGFLPGFTLGGAGASAWADATGLAGGEGDDTLFNDGLIDLDAIADALAVGVSVEMPELSPPEGFGLDLGLTLADVETRAEAIATGLSGGAGNDVLGNGENGVVRVDATATAESDGVAATASFEDQGVISEGVLVRASSDADAEATAIDAGDGDDTIVNNGSAESDATATARTVGVSVALEGVSQGGAGGIAAVDGRANANATSRSISGGAGADQLYNDGALVSNALATADATGVSVALTAAVSGGFAAGGTISLTGAEATAEANGVDWSGGGQVAENDGSIDVDATANASSDSVSVGVSGTTSGLTLNASLADASTVADATARGFYGGTGSQSITNRETLSAVSNATATSVSVGVELGVVVEGGVAAGAALTRAVTDAISNSYGVVSDFGFDVVTNLGTITSEANADAHAPSVAIGLNGTFAGVALNAAAADASSSATAHAAGIDTGLFGDVIRTDGTLTATSDAGANADSVSVQLAIAAQAGLAAGAALARTDVVSNASAVGVAAGDGADRVRADGVVDVSASSEADVDSVAVSVQGTAVGAAIGATLLEAGVVAGADASGLNAGAGNDVVVNTSTLTSRGEADADATSVGVTVGAAGAGVVAGLGLANAAADATAVGVGIEGGLGADWIVNEGVLDIDGDAETNVAAVSVVLEGVLTGGSLAVSLTDASSDAVSLATGIAGDDGLRDLDDDEADGDDQDVELTGAANGDFIRNEGAVTVDSRAVANGASVAISAPVAFVPIGTALAEARAVATGEAYGVDAGYGDDWVSNSGDLTVTSDVDVGGSSAATSLTAFALGDFNAEGYSSAYGIAGGTGDDVLFNDAAITTNVFSDVSGVTVGLNLIGGAVGLLGTLAGGDSFGMAGGAGADILVNEGVVSTSADVLAKSTGVSLTLIGVSLNDVSTRAFADAIGVDGGDGDDGIENSGEVTVSSFAETPAVSLALNGSGVAINDAETHSDTISIGLFGGGGDDLIVNDGIVSSTSTAETKGTILSIGVVSGGTANAGIIADAGASGVDGGEGDDSIVNRGELGATARAEASSTSVTVTVAGGGFADADARAIALAAGIGGGAGDDAIFNEGDINSMATATNTARSVSVTLGGASSADVNTTAHASAVGIDGGDGDDLISHEGTISASAIADVDARSIRVGLVGGSVGDVRLTAGADSVGLDGGAGDDEIVTAAGSDVIANASITGSAVSTDVELVGGASGRNLFEFSPASVAVAGGDGADTIWLEGTSTALASGGFTLTNTQIVLLGAALQDTGVTFSPEATGVSGGAGDDTIYVADALSAGASSAFSMSGLTVNLAGYSGAQSAVGGVSSAVGVDGGDGDDTVEIDGAVSVSALANNSVTGTHVTIIGANDSATHAGAIANAAGVMGGAGADVLLTNGATNVSAAAGASLSTESYVFGGASIGRNGLTVEAEGVGVSGGEDEDLVVNQGDMVVDSLASLTTSGAAGVTVGAAVTGAATGSTSLSSGMLGGDGADELLNTGTLTAIARAGGAINRVGYVFVGGAVSSSAADAEATAVGMDGGADDDAVQNDGVVTVHALAQTEASGNTSATVGGAKSSSVVTAGALGVGLSGGSGADVLWNFGEIDVAASASADSTNLANVGGLFVDGVTVSTARTTARAFGIDAGGGEGRMLNDGAIVVETLGLARTESRSDGDTLDNIFGLDLNAKADATSSFNGQDARGVTAGDGDDWLENNGTIDVAIRGHGYAYANADGDAFASGDGTATAVVGVSDATAYGFLAGQGDNTLVNTGDIIVLARPTGNADAISDADGIDAGRQPDSTASASVALHRVRAFGGWFGDGDDQVVNEGLIDVTSEPRADQAEADAGYGGDVLGIDAIASATASVNWASAYGLSLGGGANQLNNSGEIIARAIPVAVANADADAVGFDGDADGSATATARDAVAIAVDAGDGFDAVWNTGSIVAVSNPSVSATVSRSTGAACLIDVDGFEICERGEAGGSGPVEDMDGRRAVGVSLNGGDDLLVNSGSITASIGGGVGNGDAILMGAGDDTLALMDGSSVLGRISLGAGDDVMRLSGVSSANRNASGDGGVDTLIFEGEGAFDSGFTNFEIGQKFGAGVFSVASLPSLSAMEIYEGRLHSEADYTFQADGVFSTFVSASGAHGAFSSGGDVTLGGAIEITERFGLYANGQAFDVITANSLAGSFAEEILPEARPLLNFELAAAAGGLQVVANAASFATVASADERDQAFALLLDDAAETARGPLAGYLAYLQHLPEGSDFETIIALLNPARYRHYTHHTHRNVGRFEGGARRRLGYLRGGWGHGAGIGFGAGYGSLGLTHEGRNSARRAGAWKAELGTQVNGIGAGYGSIHGFDHIAFDGSVAGASIVSTRTDPLSSSVHGGDARSVMMSIYGSRQIDENQYLDAVVTYGEQDYATSLPGLSGSRGYAQPSEHDGASFSLSVETGRAYAFAGGKAEVFGGLRYASILEDGFGAARLPEAAFDAQESQSHRLESEIGVRTGWEIQTAVGEIMPRVSLSWSRSEALSGDRFVATFEDAPGFVFDMPGNLRNRDELRLGTEIDWRLSDRVSVTFRLQADMLDPDESVDSLVGLRMIW